MVCISKEAEMGNHRFFIAKNLECLGAMDCFSSYDFLLCYLEDFCHCTINFIYTTCYFCNYYYHMHLHLVPQYIVDAIPHLPIS
jgi:hypothetical protein